MRTILWKMLPNNIDEVALYEAATLLRKGEIVAFPTETVYGLGADALNPKAVEKIYLAKGRPVDNPLIVHVYNLEQVKELVSFLSPQAELLIEKFWPGPLTLVLPKSAKVPDIITAGLETVAIRMPAHPVALKLLAKAQLPIAAPSANTSGKPSPTTAQHVWQDLHGKIAGIIDGGRADIGVESTVIDVTSTIPIILRPGGITREDLEKVIGQVRIDPAVKDVSLTPKSPGMKYTHYSPNAEVFIVIGDENQQIEKIINISQEISSKKRGFLLSADIYAKLPQKLIKQHTFKIIGRRNELTTIATNLYAALRWFDLQGIEEIYAESYSEKELGYALMNRMYKAAGGKII